MPSASLIKGRSDVIVRDGAVDEAAAHRNRLSEHDVLEDVRLNGNVGDIRDVSLAVLERNGHLSVVRGHAGRLSNPEGAMPFKSQAQRRKFAELLVEGKISKQTFEEWNRETGAEVA